MIAQPSNASLTAMQFKVLGRSTNEVAHESDTARLRLLHRRKDGTLWSLIWVYMVVLGRREHTGTLIHRTWVTVVVYGVSLITI